MEQECCIPVISLFVLSPFWKKVNMFSPVQVECTASYLFPHFLQNQIKKAQYWKLNIHQTTSTTTTVARTSNIADTKSNSKKTFEKVPVVCNASDIN